ncbi:MAG: LiaI-LiaF-like domain-containing protein [bacterium]
MMRLSVMPVLDAIVLILIGGVIWLSNLHLIHIVWRRDWPLIIVLIGIAQLIKYFFKKH